MKTTALALLAATTLTACASSPPAPEAPLTAYVCNGSPTSVTADYYTTHNPRAVIKFEEKSYTLYPTPAASGVRYSTSRHRNPAAGNFIWWVKGQEAMLYKVTKSANSYTYESQLANCTSNPQPLQLQSPSSLPVPNPLPGTIPGTAPGRIYAPQSTTTM